MLVGAIFACKRQRGLPVCEGWAVVDDASAAGRPCPVQGAFAMGSTELPASALCGCWGGQETGRGLGRKKPFYGFRSLFS